MCDLEHAVIDSTKQDYPDLTGRQEKHGLEGWIGKRDARQWGKWEDK